MRKYLNLGSMGVVYLEDMDFDSPVGKIILDGHTDFGLRVHVVQGFSTPQMWKNALCVPEFYVYLAENEVPND